MKKLKDQRGFSFIEILLLLLLLLLLIFIFWYVWSQNNKPDDSDANSSSIQPASQTEKKTPAAEANYLTVKEKDIKFELSDKISDAYYYINKDGYVYFSIHKFDGVKGLENCAAKGEFGQGSGLVALVEAKVGGNNGYGGTWTKADISKQSLVKVGNTYYGFQGNDQAYCWDTANPKFKDYNSYITGLKQAFYDTQSTITAAN